MFGLGSLKFGFAQRIQTLGMGEGTDCQMRGSYPNLIVNLLRIACQGKAYVKVI